MKSKIFRILALVIAVGLLAAIVWGGKLFTSSSTDHAAHAAQSPAAADQHADHGANAPAAKPGERKVLYWYDPMHPSYKSDKPGIAPDCGMDLVPKYEGEESAGGLPAGINISPERQQLMGIRTGLVDRKSLVRDVRTTAQIAADETAIANINVKVPGYIEKVYVDFVGQLVKKGQPLFTLYSPELVSAQEEYLIAKRGERTLAGAPYQEVSAGAQSLLRSARERLRLWDISDEQIRKLDETGQVSKTLTFYSPVTGFVTERKVFPNAAVSPEMPLYTISDLSRVWAIADVYEYELPYVRVGQTAAVQLSYYPGRAFTGKIAYVYPSLDPMSRTAKVRIELPNPKFEIKPQMFADVQLKVNYGQNVVVPRDAVLNSGTQQTIFVVRDDGSFEPRKVTVGPVVGNEVVVLSGLSEGETIVTSGNFLIDSESRMQSAAGDEQHQH